MWPQLPREWSNIEVPFQFRVGTPRVVSMFGLELVRYPLEASLRYQDPRVWCLWSALHTLFVQEMITEWVHELKCGRLFWIPEPLVTAMHEIGLRHLVCTPD